MFLFIYFSMNRLRRPEVKKNNLSGNFIRFIIFNSGYMLMKISSTTNATTMLQAKHPASNNVCETKKKIYHKYSSSNIFKDIDVKLFEQCQFFIFLLFVLYHT